MDGIEGINWTYWVLHPFVVGGDVVLGIWDQEYAGGEDGFLGEGLVVVGFVDAVGGFCGP
jgi:hypothetical protein